MEKIPSQVKHDIRKIIATHAHIMQRVKKGDDRTMRTHTMSMIDSIERTLLKHNPDLFTWKKSSIIKRLFQHIFKVNNQYSDDSYVNNICLIMQTYRYRTDLINANFKLFGNTDAAERKDKKEKHTAEAIHDILHLKQA